LAHFVGHEDDIGADEKISIEKFVIGCTSTANFIARIKFMTLFFASAEPFEELTYIPAATEKIKLPNPISNPTLYCPEANPFYLPEEFMGGRDTPQATISRIWNMVEVIANYAEKDLIPL